MCANHPSLTIGLVQIAPVWLKREETLDKICTFIERAGSEGCQLTVFGEGIIPGYPFWLSFLDGAEFNSSIQKELYAHYANQAVQIERGDLDLVCAVAKSNRTALYLGIIERPADRGGHSLYCSLVYVNSDGVIQSIHRKLQPTYEERLVWAMGDGHGLVTHELGGFSVGGLNCWENWMPLARSALYAQGMNLLISVWPGSVRNTEDITRFIAMESRSYVVSVAGLMSPDKIPTDIPYAELIFEKAPKTMADGGSCLAGPNGQWIIPPVAHKEEIIIAEIDLNLVLQERQNFDPSGHYSRPDITHLTVNPDRQSVAQFTRKQKDGYEI